jgi:hypothetical protein
MRSVATTGRGGWRPGLLALLFALGLILGFAACGDDDEGAGDGATVQRECSPEPPDGDWNGRARIDPASGEVDVRGFNAYLESAEPPISTSPCDAVHVFAQGVAGDPGSGEVSVEVEPEGSAEATATVLAEGLADDSIEAQRWTLRFEPGEGDRVRVAEARVEYRCRPGRGHRDFSSELCL